MSEEIRIVRVITRLNIGGPSIQAIALTRSLRDAGYKSLLVAGECEADDGDMRYLLRPDDRVVHIAALSRSVAVIRNFRAFVRLCVLIARERPHIVHTHTAMAGCLGRTAAWICRVPIIVHTFHGNSLAGYFSPLKSAVFQRIEQLLARITDLICVVSDQQRRELSDDLGIAQNSKFRVVRLGLDLSRFTEMSFCDDAPGRLCVGWFGRLVPIKDIGLLCNAIEETLRRSSRVEFHIAGDGPERGLVQRLVERFPESVTWHGWQRDIGTVLSRCSVLIQTSLNEGTPVALIQGMAAGRPFVSTDAGGVVDMVEGTEQVRGSNERWFANGVLVGRIPEAFASVLVALEESRCQLDPMRIAARRFAVSQFAEDRLVREIKEVYGELLVRNGVMYSR